MKYEIWIQNKQSVDALSGWSATKSVHSDAASAIMSHGTSGKIQQEITFWPPYFDPVGIRCFSSYNRFYCHWTTTLETTDFPNTDVRTMHARRAIKNLTYSNHSRTETAARRASETLRSIQSDLQGDRITTDLEWTRTRSLEVIPPTIDPCCEAMP